MPGSRDMGGLGRSQDAGGNPGKGASFPSVKEQVIDDLAAALDAGDLDEGNDALGKFLELSFDHARRSVLRATGSADNIRVDDVCDCAATRRAVKFYALIRSVNAAGAKIEDTREFASSFVNNALAEIWGFIKNDGRSVPPLFKKLEDRDRDRKRRRREQPLDVPIAGKTDEEGGQTFADVCEDTKTPQPWQICGWREELECWREVAGTHPSRSVKKVLPELVDLWSECDFDICPLDLYEMRPIDPPRVDEELLSHMQETLKDEDAESLAQRVFDIKHLLARYELIEPRGVPEELRARVKEFISYARQAPEDVCSSRQRESVEIVGDYLLMSLSGQEFQPNSAANVPLRSLLLEYKCRVNPAVIDHLEERLGDKRDTLQKCLKRLREILLSDPSSVLRRSNPRETN